MYLNVEAPFLERKKTHLLAMINHEMAMVKNDDFLVSLIYG
jgi:hypothetical protein